MSDSENKKGIVSVVKGDQLQFDRKKASAQDVDVSEHRAQGEGLVPDIPTIMTALSDLDEVVLIVRAGANFGDPPAVVFANGALERVLGIKRVSSKVGSYNPTGHSREWAELWSVIVAGLDTATATRNELTWTGEDGCEHYLDVSATPVERRDEKEPVQWAVVARDITEARVVANRSSQAQRLESLGLLAASIAHDFSNLAHVMNGYHELALDALDSGTSSRDHLMQASDAAKRVAALAKQLLAFSRRQSIEPTRLDLRDILDSIHDVLVRVAGPRVKVFLDRGDSPAMVCADPAQMEQILLNLVVNAREAQPDGGHVEILIDVLSRDHIPPEHPIPYASPAPCWVRLRAIDGGAGIPPAVRAKAFEPFFTTKTHGTGLGLSTVHGIVKQNKGSIILSSPPNEGLCVEILLPEDKQPKPEK